MLWLLEHYVRVLLVSFAGGAFMVLLLYWVGSSFMVCLVWLSECFGSGVPLFGETDLYLMVFKASSFGRRFELIVEIALQIEKKNLY